MTNVSFTDKIDEASATHRQNIINHKLYKNLKTIDDLQIFMKHHVFAVWDFMSLVKALQNHLTCTQIPWLPKGNPELRHFINEIVLGEESDFDENGDYFSHFEMYLKAMRNCGASTSSINFLVDEVNRGTDLFEALNKTPLDYRIRKFVRDTFQVVYSNKPHVMAAVFAYGREELIPDMFSAIINDMYELNPEKVQSFKYYLERHIEIDGDKHGELSRKLMNSLCGDDSIKWEEAEIAIKTALENRIGMWDTVHDEILKSRNS